MIVTRLQRIEQLEPLRDRWNDLANELPFRDFDWLVTWWNHYQHQGELYVLVVQSAAGQIAGIAPWYLDQNPISGRTVRFLGSGETCSDYLSVLAEPDLRFAVSHALAEWLVVHSGNGSGDEWDVLHLESIGPDDLLLGSLLEALNDAGCQVHQQPSLNCWRIFFGGSWDSYLAGLSKSHRKHMRQVRNRLTSDPSIRVSCSSKRDDDESIWERFVELHQRRRVSLGQPGCFANANFEGFLADAVAKLAQKGQAQLTLVEKNHEPLGALLTLSGGKIRFAYQMGTNPEMMKDSPGWMVIAASISAAIEAGDTALDLLRGNEPYKARMGAIPVEMMDARVIAPQWGAKLRHTAWLTGTAVKRWLKSGLTATGLASTDPSLTYCNHTQ